MKRWYKKQMKNVLSQEAGLTLVELLASILLISLIITTFLSFFIQAAKTNNQTDDVNEATFIAQEQLELLTYYSMEETLEQTNLELFGDKNSSEGTHEIAGFIVTTSLRKKENDSIYKGKVTVAPKKGGEPLAQMETRLFFNNP